MSKHPLYVLQGGISINTDLVMNVAIILLHMHEYNIYYNTTGGVTPPSCLLSLGTINNWAEKYPSPQQSKISTPAQVHTCRYIQGAYMHVQVNKGVTLHSCLYSHPRLGSRFWPIKFLRLTPWSHWKFGLDPWLFSIRYTYRAPGEALIVSKLASTVYLTAWSASKSHLDCLTSFWPRSRVGVQLPMQCHPLGEIITRPYRAINN